MLSKKKLFSVILVVMGFAVSATAYDPADKSIRGQNLLAHETPKELEGIKLEDKLGTQIDRNLLFTNEQGQQIPIGSLMTEDKPILFAMVYFVIYANLIATKGLSLHEVIFFILMEYRLGRRGY